jgi:NAD(P)-dependent dehydrogenase (short-subunit alcohol dehydrogenase family)
MSDILPPQTLKNKVAIVTGASRGLGAEIALQLAQRGAKARLSTYQI